ncbi:general substrate transporter [Talaromyces proteolyticus]|uniref:General substrate transporter n=1 Tax=Talaromyces proteolyticus TaxID=1131652 RepID=A0AAD4PU61_9EURO|nr:general substrate transporter [Talaromyces proteolyticus]KAH8688970.1 general substrate transporter [Talaromyces proteolyticus]
MQTPSTGLPSLDAGVAQVVPRLQSWSVGAKAATDAEHRTTFLGGCRLYPKAIAWSVIVSFVIIMDGYDKALVNFFFAFPVFRQSYGHPVNPDAPLDQRVYQISSAWQAALINASLVGELIGLFGNGFLTDRIGYRRTTIAALLWLCGSVFLAFFAVNIQMLLAAQILCGIPWGIFQTLAATYAADIMPVTLRAPILANINMFWWVGQLIALAVLRGFIGNSTRWSYRVPFALQWAFALTILSGIIFAPESPWWLIQHEKPEKARESILRLTKWNKDNIRVNETIAMMKHTNEMEKYMSNGRKSYLKCFTGTDLRRTEIACLVWLSQAFSGGGLTAYVAYFNEQVGLSVPNAFNLAMGMSSLGILGCIISWFLLPSIGRRRLYVSGLLATFIILIVGGIVSLLVRSSAQAWVLGSAVLLFTLTYNVTIGPVCYVLVAEVPSTRLRIKTLVLARVAYNVSLLLINTITTKMLNPTAWDWKGKTCFFFIGTNLLCIVWCYFRLPETFGLSYLEIDILFERKAKRGKFRTLQSNLENAGYFNLSRDDGQPNIWIGY